MQARNPAIEASQRSAAHLQHHHHLQGCGRFPLARMRPSTCRSFPPGTHSPTCTSLLHTGPSMAGWARRSLHGSMAKLLPAKACTAQLCAMFVPSSCADCPSDYLGDADALQARAVHRTCFDCLLAAGCLSVLHAVSRVFAPTAADCNVAVSLTTSTQTFNCLLLISQTVAIRCCETFEAQ